MKKDLFASIAAKTARYCGHPTAFIVSCSAVILWAVMGPVFNYSDTWQLVINTGTTVITFLVVFLIQNLQNRDSIALHLKLDELIRATEGAHTVLLDFEELSECDLVRMQAKYENIARLARERIRQGKSDMDIPEVILDQ